MHFPADDLTQHLVFDRDNTAQRLGAPEAPGERDVNLAIAKGLLQLTLSIDRAITTENDKNAVYAPVSIANALALVLLGARGKTFNELTNILGLASNLDIQSNSQRVHEHFGRLLQRLSAAQPFKDNEEVRIGTALFIQDGYPIRKVYRETAEQVYGSEIVNLDFRSGGPNALKRINSWVDERTGGKIKELLTETPPASTRVIIASALYFKGAWEMPFFDQKLTKRGNFFANGRGQPATSTCLMMTNGGSFPYYKDHNLNCEIMGFPYKGNATTMYVVMPIRSDSGKLRQLEQDLTPEALERLVGNTKYEPCAILFPKMKLEATVDLSDVLQRIGAKALFNPFEADLGLLSEGDEGAMPQPQYASSAPALSPSAGFQRPSQAPSKFPNRIPNSDDNDQLIFSRFRGIDSNESSNSDQPMNSSMKMNNQNCSDIFNSTSKLAECQEMIGSGHNVTYKRFGDKVGRKINKRDTRRSWGNGNNDRNRRQSLDNLRQQSIGRGGNNPGLYADKVLHKVFMDITETGTEAAAVTAVSLSRGGDIVTFRADVPFLFFIRNEETKLVLFWGAVTAPTS